MLIWSKDWRGGEDWRRGYADMEQGLERRGRLEGDTLMWSKDWRGGEDWRRGYTEMEQGLVRKRILERTH